MTMMNGIKTLMFVLLSASTLAATKVPLSNGIPSKAETHIVQLRKLLHQYFPEAEPELMYFAAQTEQETCISLTSKGCWNEFTELKTWAEYGFNLSQITIAYDKQGRIRFDNFKESKKLDVSLMDWQWNDRWNPINGMLVQVLMVKNEYKAVGKGTKSVLEGLKFAWSAYNGGRSNVLKAKSVCAVVSKCNPYKWDDVAQYLPQSRVPKKGYKESAYSINTEYVKNITMIRYQKYQNWLNVYGKRY
jgi:hypothetical protein